MWSTEVWTEYVWSILNYFAGLSRMGLHFLQEGIPPEVRDGANLVMNGGVTPIAILLLSMCLSLQVYRWILHGENNGIRNSSMEQITSFMWLFFKIAMVMFFIWNWKSLVWGIVDLGGVLSDNIDASPAGQVAGQIMIPYSEVEKTLRGMDLGFWGQLWANMVSMPVSIVMWVCSIVVQVLFIVRVVQILIYVAVSPIPLVTLVHSEWSHIGKGFLKSFCAVVLQGAVMLIVLQIYGVISQRLIITSASLDGLLWGAAGYGVLLVVSLVGASAMAKRLVGAV